MSDKNSYDSRMKRIALRLRCNPARFAALFEIIEVDGVEYLVEHKFATMLANGPTVLNTQAPA